MTLINPQGQEIASDVTSLTERQLKKQMGHNATIQDVVDLSHQIAVQACNHLGNQLPGLVEQIVHQRVAEALAAFAQMLDEQFVMTRREQPPQPPENAHGT